MLPKTDDVDWNDVVDAAELVSTNWRATYDDLNGMNGISNKVYELYREIKIASYESDKIRTAPGAGTKQAFGTIGGVDVTKLKDTVGGVVGDVVQDMLEDELG